jgi:hypothetical protein
MSKCNLLLLGSAALVVLANTSGCSSGTCVEAFATPAGSGAGSGAPQGPAGGFAGGSSGAAGSLADTPSYSASSGGSSSGYAGGADATRTVVEADIVELGSKYLYAMSKSGTLAIVDVSVPGKLTLVGNMTLPGVPFEMYEVGSYLIAMCNEATGPDGGAPVPVPDAGVPAEADDGAVPGAGPGSPDSSVDDGGVAAVDAQTATAADAQAAAGDGGTAAPRVITVSAASAAAFVDPNSAVVLALDVTDPANVTTVATFQVPGQIADSRTIGNVLYLTTYENGICDGCSDGAKTVVTTFDVTTPTQMQRIDQVTFLSNAPAAYNLAWGMAWQRSIVATPDRLYLGGQANVDPQNPYGVAEGVIDVLDVSDPAGHLGPGAHLTIPGAILSRWQMDETDGVLRVVSEQGAGFTGNGTAAPEVDTFTIQSTTSIVPLGKTTLTLPEQEGLRTVQFDGPRAYAITFNQTDPLFTIDLSNPAAPVQKGDISMPGWMFYLDPMGTQVIGLGVDRTDPNGNLNVSLFDVTDLSAPKMLTRVSFGSLGVTEDYEILNYELPEDQDNIQKAFRVFPDGLVAVPFSTVGTDGTFACSGNTASGVQLMQLSGSTLTKHAVLPVPGNPKRAIELTGELVAVSDSDVRAFSLASLDTVDQTADVAIGQCVTATLPGQTGLPGGDFGGGVGFVGDDPPNVDNAVDAGAPAGNGATSSSWWPFSGGCK